MKTLEAISITTITMITILNKMLQHRELKTYAKLVASDPDGYEGMEFMRWTSDAIGKSLTLNWEDFI